MVGAATVDGDTGPVAPGLAGAVALGLAGAVVVVVTGAVTTGTDVVGVVAAGAATPVGALAMASA